MHKKKIFPLLSSKKDMSIDTTQPTSPSPTDTTLCRYYQHISELPLSRFKDVSVNGNLAALIISGYPTPEQLHDAWAKINIQVSDAVGNQEHKLYVSLTKQVSVLEASYWQIQEVGKLLNMACEIKIFPADIYRELNRLTQSNFPFSADDHETNTKNIKRCLNRAKSIFIRIEMLRQQLEAHHEKQTTGKVTQEWFTQMLITLSDHAKFQIPETIMTYEFYERIRRYNDYYERVKSSSNGRK